MNNYPICGDIPIEECDTYETCNDCRAEDAAEKACDAMSLAECFHYDTCTECPAYYLD